ncbi:glycine betaine ABC transporter substrate-binding protein [Arthrobacter sp. Hiyo1]|uniref:glycine betaine ABC transporter substrate-binding protein n=1 Tax=Arthrobacter sp. Hiyo1 TaxID=1588020 RepID=UPI001C0F0C87|nr:glycine betaine ABC transporter substrate-binding protein [Arthrobacter sp. Hiyo1]
MSPTTQPREEPRPQLQSCVCGQRTGAHPGLPASGAEQDPADRLLLRAQWFIAEVPLVKVNLPAHTPGCDADAAKVACDYPKYELNKVVSTKFANSGSPAYSLVKRFTWTNQDQDTVAGYIAKDNMSPDSAAQKWIDANSDKVAAWLK